MSEPNGRNRNGQSARLDTNFRPQNYGAVGKKCGAGCQGKEDNFRRNSSGKQRFTVPESSITLPESAPNFRDEFAVDPPLHQRVYCEPDFLQICGAVHTPRVLDRDLARRLWDESARLVGL
jgi:hypothetical protein